MTSARTSLELRPRHVRALALLKKIGRATLSRWKRAHRVTFHIKLSSATAAQLWAARLIRFSWFTDAYEITAAGVAAIARAERLTLPLAA